MPACHPVLASTEPLCCLNAAWVDLVVPLKHKMYGITIATMLDYSQLAQWLLLLLMTPVLLLLAAYFWAVPNSLKVNIPLS